MKLNRTAVWIAVVTLLQVGEQQSIALMLPRLGAQWPESDARLLLLAYALGAALLPLWLFQTFPRLNASAASMGALIGIALANGAFAMLPPFGVALGARALTGAASGVLSASLLDVAIRTGRGAVLAQAGAFVAGIALLVPFDAWLGALIDIDGVASVYSGLALFVFIPGSHCLPFAEEVHVSPSAEEAAAQANPRERRLLLAALLSAAALAAPAAFAPAMLQSSEGANLDLGEAGMLLSFAALGPMLVMLLQRQIFRGRSFAMLARGATWLLLPALLLLAGALRDPITAALILPVILAIETVRRTGLAGLMASAVPSGERRAFLALRGLVLQLGTAVGLAAALPWSSFAAVCVLSAGFAASAAFILPRR